MSLLPEDSNDLNEYLRATRGTPYAPYNPPVDSNFTKAILLLTVFPLLGLLLPVAVGSETIGVPEGQQMIVKFAAWGMAALSLALGIPAALMAMGSDKAHTKDDKDVTVKKAKTAASLGMVGTAVGTIVVVLGVAVCFLGFLAGDKIGSSPKKEKAAAEATEGGEGAEAAPAGDAPAEGAAEGEAKTE